VAEGALSSHGSRLLMVGNPTKNTGFFARSHKADRDTYTTLRFRCSDSALVDPHYRPNLVKKYGEGSKVVRVRADGEFPKQDDDVLIPLEHAEAATTRWKARTAGSALTSRASARIGRYSRSAAARVSSTSRSRAKRTRWKSRREPRCSPSA
jgi:hypothetical protein